MKEYILSRINSFRFAISGIIQLVRNEPNARIHLIATIVCVAICSFLNLLLNEWILIILSIGLVFAAELMNSAIESISDLVSPNYHPLIKRAKDYAAGAVLILAIVAAIIGSIILIPHIIENFL